MNTRLQSQTLLFVAACFVAVTSRALAQSSAAALSDASEPRLELTRAVVEKTVALQDGRRPVREKSGRIVGRWVETEDGARIEPHGRSSFEGARLQAWTASADGRTIVGIGDSRAVEHPFELKILVYRDGIEVASIDEHFAPVSEVTVSRTGQVAIVGQRIDEPGRPWALILDADGHVILRTRLPDGVIARDPAFVGEHLWLRVHGALEEGVSGAILRLAVSGERLVVDAPAALNLVAFPEENRLLVHARDSITWIDATTGRAVWKRMSELRPVGPHAFETWSTGTSACLAVVTRGLKRANAPDPTTLLEILDLGDGARLTSSGVESLSPASELDLTRRGDELVLDWNGNEEVFTWKR